MVYTGLNCIHFGNGDVSVMLSMSGTRKMPQAMLVFQNCEPTQIGRIEEGADLSKTAFSVYDPRKDFAMYFSKPESIEYHICSSGGQKGDLWRKQPGSYLPRR